MEFVRRFAREAPACTVLILVCVAVFCVEVVQSGSLEDPVGGGQPGTGAPTTAVDFTVRGRQLLPK